MARNILVPGAMLTLAAALAVVDAPAAELQIWKDSSGLYRVEAEFVELKPTPDKGQVLVLRKSDANTLEVPLDRLAPESKKLALELAQQRMLAPGIGGADAAMSQQGGTAIGQTPNGNRDARSALRELFGDRCLCVRIDAANTGTIMSLAASGGDLYVLAQGPPEGVDAVLRVDPHSGKLSPLIQFPASYAAGISCDGNSLWVLSRSAPFFSGSSPVRDGSCALSPAGAPCRGSSTDSPS